MALEYNRWLVLNRVKAKLFSAIAALIIIVVMFFGACSSTFSGKDSKNKAPNPIKAFQQFRQDATSSTTFPTTQETQALPINGATKKALLELSTTGGLDMYYPEIYISPRWNAIIAGTIATNDDITSTYLYEDIPITELDSAENSDLDPATFTTLRNLAISVVKSEATGVGTSEHPNYFNKYVYIDSCKNFQVVAAGAISMPYPGDNSWALSKVYWKADCYPFGPDKSPKETSADQIVFLHRVGNTWKAFHQSAIPRTEIPDFSNGY